MRLNNQVHTNIKRMLDGPDDTLPDTDTPRHDTLSHTDTPRHDTLSHTDTSRHDTLSHTNIKRMLDSPVDTPKHDTLSNAEDTHVESIPIKYNQSLSKNSSGIPQKEPVTTESTDYLKDPFFKIKQKKKAGLPIIIGTINMCSWMIRNIELSEKCLDKKCVITQDNITENTDVVIAMGNALKDHMKPTQRWPGQLYVLVDREPPPVALSHSTIANETSQWRYEFNLTGTYLKSSDVYWPYHVMRENYHKKTIDFVEVAKKKTKTAAWIVSNCGGQSNRLAYVKEMQKYIDIDIYGRCGNKSSCRRGGPSDCMAQELTNYSFYLSFESAMCTDYITEKAFKMYIDNNYIVPVVRGLVDYDQVLPKGSFIDAAKFQSPKDLALFLKSLRTDYVRYSEYLRIKEGYRNYWTEGVFCGTCKGVVNESLRPKRYDILQWMNSQCRDPVIVTRSIGRYLTK
ncbi:alpha-(1,3)-fucosyltransferase C-like [Physella acuta]|uniref:alpha-(1,3)-fucosyltransferase C-like n=1 Tax=Physella acuta TaxID=109671 RepID=UPI0027DBF421|nr:alpha-(1,3)-fucosyltransferase C-like [Physella acuta]